MSCKKVIRDNFKHSQISNNECSALNSCSFERTRQNVCVMPHPNKCKQHQNKPSIKQKVNVREECIKNGKPQMNKSDNRNSERERNSVLYQNCKINIIEKIPKKNFNNEKSKDPLCLYKPKHLDPIWSRLPVELWSVLMSNSVDTNMSNGLGGHETSTETSSSAEISFSSSDPSWDSSSSDETDDFPQFVGWFKKFIFV